MGKFRPGIPATFTLDVRPVADLGDYLDERPAAPAARTARPEPSPPAGAVGAPAPERAHEAPQANKPTAPPQPAPPQPEPPATGRRPRVKAPRREISMAPEVLRLSDELIALIRRGSGQRDTMPSEVFHALVLLASEAMAEFDPHAIPKRGRWGTPTARAYPVELKNAFLRAVLVKHCGNGPAGEGRGAAPGTGGGPPPAR